MDRDTRWDRTEKAVKLLMEGEAEHDAESGEAAAKEAYERDETDEFITATKVGDEDSTIRPGDSVLAFNFRPDRMRQITEALDKAGVDRYATLTEYEEGWPYPVAFPPERPDMTLAKLIAGRGETQLHVAETEKYPHVTYFFNGGEEEPYEGEVRELVDSPRDVADVRREAGDERARGDRRVREALGGRRRRCSGSSTSRTRTWSATPASSRRRSRRSRPSTSASGRIVEAVARHGRRVHHLADHGNADEMLEEDGSPDTAHSLNPVPFLVTLDGARLDGEGILADVAPTVLALLGIEQPEEMTGRSLLATDD